MSEASGAKEDIFKDLRIALGKAFKGLRFERPELRQIIYESYKMNLLLFLQYAESNKLNPREYVESIRKVLVDTGTAYEY
jgi:hypothetical protein